MICNKSWEEIKKNPELAKNVMAELNNLYACGVEDDEVDMMLHYHSDIFTKAVLKTAQIEFDER